MDSPVSEKEWACEGLVIGYLPPMGSVGVNNQMPLDLILLYQNTLKVDWRTGSEKRRDLDRNRYDFLHLPTGVHQRLQAERTGGLFYVGLDTAFRKQCIAELTLSLSLDELFTKGTKLTNHEELSDLLLDFLLSGAIGGKLRAQALATLLFTEVLQHLDCSTSDSPKHRLAPQKMKLVTSYIDDHIDTQISIDDLAEIVGVGKFHFARMFKLETGMSPYQFVLQQRVRRLRSLLVDSRKSLSELAYEVGFSSQSHMSETFRKIVGVTPGRYRREMNP